jgi:hypothetical protein
MSDVNIKQVEGGEVTTLSDADGVEIDTGTNSVWIKISNLVQEVLKRIANLTARTSPATTDELTIVASGVAYKITPENFLKIINSLTADASPDTAADYAITYDASAGGVKKVLLNLIGASKMVQRVYSEDGAVATGTTTLPADDTIPQNTEGTQFLSVSITPSSATNILDIEVSVMVAASAIVHISAALFQDSTANALAARSQKALAAGDLMQITFMHSMVAGTTSATTFKVRIGGSGASTITLNGFSGGRIFGGVSASIIRVTERLP